METSAIGYRVVDFLKQHPPFQAIEDSDLLALAERGRVRFHEANEYILWQGEPHKLHVFVIQQGTVSLWDESSGETALRDVRGAGDMLGVERFTGAPCCLHSARSTSDVVIYSFPASDFEDLILKYPYARRFVEAHDTVTADYQWASDVRDPQSLFLHDLIGQRGLQRLNAQTSIRDAAKLMLTTGADALPVVDADNRVEGIATSDALLAWVAAGAGDAGTAIATLMHTDPPAVGPGASVIDGMLAIGEAGATALTVTTDGAPRSQLHAIVTAKDIGRAFGEQPIAILREIRLAATIRDLRELNHRARGLALQHLANASGLDWVARFICLADEAIVTRILALTAAELPQACWCFAGAGGRRESLTRHAPQLVLVAAGDGTGADLQQQYARVSDGLTECDYMPRDEMVFDRSFYAAGVREWQARFEQWLRDPVRTQMYLARPMFDLRPIHGSESLWRDLEATVTATLDRDFLQLVANDCLASLPPLTFFQDAVVEESGEQASVFRLEHSALQPLVDVGRVFGMAAKKVLGTSTSERYGSARRLLPEHEFIFREAAETLRILLWQQARIGIAQGTSGSELPPSLLSRHDRHILKSGFRSILRLLEFTGNSPWFATV